MNGAARTAVLVELGASHEFCLHAQALVLARAGWKVSILCSARLRPLIEGIEGAAGEIELLEPDEGPVRHLRRLDRVRRRIREIDPGVVVFNTAHGPAVRNYLLPPRPSAARRIGVLHQVDRLGGSFSQRVISSRLDGYLVLADRLLALVPPDLPLPVGSFYPIFFPRLPGPGRDDPQAPPEKPPEQVWIAVPGSVDFARRDYPLLRRLGPSLCAHPEVRLVLLGRSDPSSEPGRRIRREIAAAGIADRVRLFDRFVPPAAFQAWLRRSDLVMPLQHPGRPEFARYRSRVSGAFLLAAGWKVPLLADRWFARHADHAGNALFYDPDRPDELLDGLPRRLADVRDRAFRQAAWTVEAQSERYLDLLRAAQLGVGSGTSSPGAHSIM